MGLEEEARKLLVVCFGGVEDDLDGLGVPGVFTAPWWPVKFVIFASTALCSLLFLLKATVRPSGRAPR